MSKRRRLCITKRACIALMLLLVSGTIVNVAVAWGLRVKHDFETQALLRTNVNPEQRWRGFSTKVIAESNWTVVSSIEIDMRLPILAGWPCSAMESFTFWYDDDKLVQHAGMWNSGIHIPPNSLGLQNQLSIELPVKPIWPGFAINTVFYAVLLWLLFALGGTPFALRRRRRIKRGLCPKCAYPRGAGTNEVCTECGEAVHSTARVMP